MSTQYADIKVAASNTDTFTNVATGDMILFTETNTQSIHLGTFPGASSTMKITRSNIDIIGSIATGGSTRITQLGDMSNIRNINFTGSLLNNGVPFKSGTQGLSNATGSVYVLPGSNFGINTSTPQYELDVNGNINFSGSLLNNGIPFSSGGGSIDGLVSTGSNVYVANNYNFAVGTIAPQARLHVVGASRFEGDIELKNRAFTFNSIKVGAPQSTTIPANVTSVITQPGPFETDPMTNNIQITGSIIPASNLMYDLGSSNNRFRDLYISGNTINMSGTRISTDASQNLRITNSNNQLKRIIVDQIQIGDTSPTLLTKGGVVTLSNINQSINATSPAYGFSSNVVSVPTATIQTMPSSAIISYGRVTLGAHANNSLAAGAQITITISHQIGNANYIVYASPEDPSSIQVKCSNYTDVAFDMTIKNITASSLSNPAINYQIVHSANTVTATIPIAKAAYVIPGAQSNNMTFYSSANNATAIKSIDLNALNAVIDDQGYQISYSLQSDQASLLMSTDNNAIYQYSYRQATGPQGSVIFTAQNAYNPDPNARIQINIVESNLGNPLSSVSSPVLFNWTTYNIGSNASYTLPASDQSQGLIYTLGSNNQIQELQLSSVSPGSNNVLTFATQGSTEVRDVALNVNFSPSIMSETLLATKTLIFRLSESSSGGWFIGTQPSLSANENTLWYVLSTPSNVNSVTFSGFPSSTITQWSMDGNVYNSLTSPSTIQNYAFGSVQLYTTTASINTFNVPIPTTGTIQSYSNLFNGRQINNMSALNVKYIKFNIRSVNPQQSPYATLPLGNSKYITPAMTQTNLSSLGITLA